VILEDSNNPYRIRDCVQYRGNLNVNLERLLPYTCAWWVVPFSLWWLNFKQRKVFLPAESWDWQFFTPMLYLNAMKNSLSASEIFYYTQCVLICVLVYSEHHQSLTWTTSDLMCSEIELNPKPSSIHTCTKISSIIEIFHKTSEIFSTCKKRQKKNLQLL
jgi:hypothetical protein